MHSVPEVLLNSNCSLSPSVRQFLAHSDLKRTSLPGDSKSLLEQSQRHPLWSGRSCMAVLRGKCSTVPRAVKLHAYGMRIHHSCISTPRNWIEQTLFIIWKPCSTTQIAYWCSSCFMAVFHEMVLSDRESIWGFFLTHSAQPSGSLPGEGVQWCCRTVTLDVHGIVFCLTNKHLVNCRDFFCPHRGWRERKEKEKENLKWSACQ